MWGKTSVWILALPFTSCDLQQVLWALCACSPYANGDDDDAWGYGEGERLLLWINHLPPPLQNLNQTTSGTRWRLKCSNWLVISTAGQVNKMVLRQKLGSLPPPSAPQDLALGDTRKPQGAGKRAARGRPAVFCPLCGVFWLLKHWLMHSITSTYSFIPQVIIEGRWLVKGTCKQVANEIMSQALVPTLMQLTILPAEGRGSNHCSISPGIRRGDYIRKILVKHLPKVPGPY